MSRTVAAAAAAAIALAIVSLIGPAGQAKEESETQFDLGIDVTQLPQDAVRAKAYFATLPADTQHVLKAACDTFVKHPADAEMPQTIKFCEFIIGQ
jgi:hypothetical protein